MHVATIYKSYVYNEQIFGARNVIKERVFACA